MTVPFTPYNPGTITTTTNGTAVVGVGTNFTAYAPYDEIWVSGYALLITAIADDTHMTTTIFRGTGAGTLAYVWVPTPDLSRALTINQTLYSYLQTGNVSALAALTLAANKGIKATGAGTLATFDLTAAGLALLDDADAAAQRATLGVLALAGGTLTGLLTTNGQVAFPASKNGSSNANTLDDYEEGTTSPTVTPVSGSFTSVICNLFYTAIGDLVIGCANVNLAATNTGSGEFLVPLPFTAARDTVGLGINYNNLHVLSGRILSGTATLRIADQGSTPGVSGQTLYLLFAYKL